MTHPEPISHDSGADARQFLTFSVGAEAYGVDIMTVHEIKGWTQTTRLPSAPAYMRGVINLRGLIVPIFDLRARFALGLTEVSAHHVVIIVAVGARTVGILVDAVSDILTVSPEDIKPKPESQAMAAQDYVQGLISVDSRMVVLLDIERLFGAEAQHVSGLEQAA